MAERLSKWCENCKSHDDDSPEGYKDCYRCMRDIIYANLKEFETPSGWNPIDCECECEICKLKRHINNEE